MENFLKARGKKKVILEIIVKARICDKIIGKKKLVENFNKAQPITSK